MRDGRESSRPHSVRSHPCVAAPTACIPARLAPARLGHTDPALALSIYAHAMRREDGENERLRVLVNGEQLAMIEAGVTVSG